MAEPEKKRVTYADLDAVPPYPEIAPDRVCEVLSVSTETHDRTVEMRIYAEAGIPQLRPIDPRLQSLEVLEHCDGQWIKVGAWNPDDEVRAPPSDEISFALADLWPLDLNESPQALYAGDR